jgi:hypothetical protein
VLVPQCANPAVPTDTVFPGLSSSLHAVSLKVRIVHRHFIVTDVYSVDFALATPPLLFESFDPSAPITYYIRLLSPLNNITLAYQLG